MLSPEILQVLTSWTRNVKDEFKPLSQEEITAHLRATSLPFAVAFEHWLGDFNMATGIRNANGFNAKEVFYIGKRKYDRRACVGVHKYVDLQYLPTIPEFLTAVKDRYTLIGIDNNITAQNMIDFVWPENTLMIFGEEGVGLTSEMKSICEAFVEIPMFGSVRSFNCGTASGIAMYDLVSKLKR